MYNELINKTKNKNIKVGIVGLGYVGLPLARAFSLKKVKTFGFDSDKSKVLKLRKGLSYIKDFPNSTIVEMKKNNFECFYNFEK